MKSNRKMRAYNFSKLKRAEELLFEVIQDCNLEEGKEDLVKILDRLKEFNNK